MFQDDKGTLYVGGVDLGGDRRHSFYSSQDGGKTWNSVDANGKDDKSIFDGGGVAGKVGAVVEAMFQDENTKTLYVGGYELGGGQEHSFYSSHDGGTTWNSVDAKEDGQSIFDGGVFGDNKKVETMFQDENTKTKTLYVGGIGLGGNQEHSFYSSQDGGITWNSVEANGKDDKSIFDGGVFGDNKKVETMFQDENTKTLYVGGIGLGGNQEHSFYSSQDGGKTWNSVEANGKDDKSIFDEGGDGEVYTMFQDESTKTLYVGGNTLGGGGKHTFYSSQDGGTTWNSVDAKEDGQSIFDGGVFGDNKKVETMFQDENTKTLYVGGDELGGDRKHTFYSSQDGGKTWNSVDANGKDDKSIFDGRYVGVNTMFQDENTKTLYVGGYELGGDGEHTFYSSPALNLNIKISIDNNSNYHPYEPKNLDNNEYVFKGDITISFNDIFNTLKQYNLQDKYYLMINDNERITNENNRS